MTEQHLPPALYFEPLPTSHFPLVKQFYKACRYPNSPGRLEKVYVLKNTAQQIVAAVRYLPEEPNDHQWFLRSLCTAPSIRRQGAALQLLTQSLQHLKPELCHCFPFDYLQNLYQAAGFQMDKIENANQLRQTQWASYQKHGKGLIYMSLYRQQ